MLLQHLGDMCCCCCCCCQGYELDVNGWEDAAGMAELDCYKEWQCEDKPAYYTGA